MSTKADVNTLPKSRDKATLRRALLITIHKDLQDFVVKNTQLAGCKNESEWINQVIRRLKGGAAK